MVSKLCLFTFTILQQNDFSNLESQAVDVNNLNNPITANQNHLSNQTFNVTFFEFID